MEVEIMGDTIDLAPPRLPLPATERSSELVVSSTEVKEAMARIDHWTAEREARKPRHASLYSGAPVPHPSPIRSRGSDLLARWLKARP